MVDSFGPGIVVATSRTVRFVLSRPASVIVLQVFPDGIDVITPRHSGDRTSFAAGEHRVDMPALAEAPPGVSPTHDSTPSDSRCLADYAEAVAQQPRDSLGRPLPRPGAPDPRQLLLQCQDRGRGARLPTHDSVAVSPPEEAYWMVIVADVPTSAAELQRRLRPMDITHGDRATVLRELPGVLIGQRTEHWAAYYTPVGR